MPALPRAPRELPRRFRPYWRQSVAQAELQFGGAGDLLEMLLSDAIRERGRSVRQARGSADMQVAAVNQAKTDLTENLRTAGLDMTAMAGTPQGQQLAASYARSLNELDERKILARDAAASGVRQARQEFREDAGKIAQQLQRHYRDRGIYTSSLLDELIGEDRGARRAARAAAAEQAFEAEQNALDRAGRLDTAIIGQGLNPQTGRPLPGAKSNKPKLTAGQRLTANEKISSAIAQAKTLAAGGHTEREALEILTAGRDGSTLTIFRDKNGREVPEYVRQRGRDGNPKRVKNPRISEEETIKVPKIPAYQQMYARAAIEAAYNNGGRLSPETAKRLRRAGIRLRDLDVRLPNEKPKRYTLPNRPGARPRSQQPG